MLVEEALTPKTPPWPGITDVTIDPFILVDHPDDPHWRAIPVAKKINDLATFDRDLARYLVTLAETDASIARTIAAGFPDDFSSDNAELKRALWPDLARRLLKLNRRQAGTTLPLDLVANLQKFLALQKFRFEGFER